MSDKLREALEHAARSLETIATHVGIDDFLSDWTDVRGYAANRARVAREALAAEQPKPEPVAWRAIHREGWPFPWKEMPFPEHEQGYFDFHKMKIEYAHTAPLAATVPDGLIEALRAQEQADADGCRVKVSREAVDKAIELLLAAAPKVQP